MGYTSTAETGQQISWRDPKRYAWILSGILPLIALACWGLYAWTGSSISWFAGPLLVFVVIPTFDIIVGKDAGNPPDEVLDALENDRYYRWVTYAYVPAQLGTFFWACFLLGDGTIFGWDPYGTAQQLLPGLGHHLSVLEKVGLTTSIGMVAGIGINTAHELGHKKDALERWFARVALGQTAYGHFYIEHNRGHHVRVATPPDPASSRLGESFIEFFPRTVIGSLRSAWNLETKRFARLGTSKWTLRNDILNAWAFTVGFWGLALAAFGDTLALKVALLGFLILQGAIGWWLLESVNYLEHYGMLRKRLDSGRYERVNPSHSWNSNNIITNIFLYHLQRHSDHHANPTRRYQALREFPEAPVLPTGYAGSIILANLTPVWRRIMDRKVIEHLGGVENANLHPRTAQKYVRKYGGHGPEAMAA
jgi:alkane 1-monooxygenase